MAKSHIKSLFDVLPKNAPKAQKELLSAFAKELPESDADLFTSDMIRDMINIQWSLAQEREPGKPSISITCAPSQTEGLKKTIINLVHDDMAFLIDSIAAKINDSDLLIDILLHPIVGIERDKNDKIIAIKDKKDENSARQSHMCIHITEPLSDYEMQSLEAGLRTTMDDVLLSNRDWPAMLKTLKKAREDLERAKTKTPAREISRYCDFLDYLYNNNFTLLGYREYDFIEKGKKISSKTVTKSGLGILHSSVRPAYINDHEEGLPHHLQEMRRNLPAVYVSKTNRIATVHRRVPMDAIAIKKYNAKGKVVGEHLFLGLFTSVTYSRSVSDVPYLREKVEDVMKISGFLDGSHDRKALRHILEKYPRDELFQIPPQDLFDITLNILRLQERQRISLFTRQDPFGRYISCLVYIPRDRFGTKLRKEIGAVLENELKGETTSFSTTLDDSVFARVMFIITIKDKQPPTYNVKDIEAQLQIVGKTWSERLNEALVTSNINEHGYDILALKEKYSEAFPVAYTEHYTAKQSVFDIQKIETALETKRIALDLYKINNGDAHLRLKVYSPGTPLNLSDVLPILENMGLKVSSELPFQISPLETNQTLWIHDFELQISEHTAVIDLEAIKDNFEEAFAQAWYKTVENDKLNALVLTAGLTWRETTILRCYVRYMKQARTPFSRSYIHKALNTHTHTSAALVAYFTQLFDPKTSAENREEQSKKTAKTITRHLNKVESLDHDRILRTIMAMIDGTLRTNYFQTDETGAPKPCLSVKLDSAKIPGLPKPVPYREIFVYSPRVEAIHLRGDTIARGGLRWSDRREDFRTEVLGLMKAQMVKNSVIVPVGAKGGFVLKKTTHSRDEFRAEGIQCYKIFIRGMLDISDNLQGEKVIPPKDVVRRDGDDPYLVVAADKGTATFSDTANGISQEYGFWLDDAFASGGSAGYDHKVMGITAKGAWESVKLHFRHLNHDIQNAAFDVTGVGDMGGDVFGNGMLLSKHINLIGAFNHLHIFCDPTPDATSSFKERQRLFDNVMGWDEYNTKLLSKGGRIYNRSDKTLKLTPEIQKRFDLDQATATPNELMRAILKARTDLLWFGGIGTYIKHENEDDEDVGDKANDTLRINGKDLRTKVLGEGANLAITQLGRIEFAQNGGHINTDFIDNSGGVDSSDHEVNIKILMSDVMQSKAHKMDIKARNILLESMTEKVGQHVLRNNYQQAQAISMSEFKAKENLLTHKEFIKNLEDDVGLNRDIEYLPSDKNIDERAALGKGLTRPELCVLTSYSKIQLTKDFLASPLPDDPDAQVWMTNYFPGILNEKYETEISNHRLRREIISMRMANSIVNRMGPSFVFSKIKKTGSSHAALAKAYTIVREIYDMRPLWDAIESLDNTVPADVQMKAMHTLTHVMKRTISWFLSHKQVDLDILKHTEQYKEGIATLKKDLSKVLPDHHTQTMLQNQKAYERDGIPADIAKIIAETIALTSAPDIIHLAATEKTDLVETASTYFAVGQRFHLDWLRSRSAFTAANDQTLWHDEAMAGMVGQLYSLQANFTKRILKDPAVRKATNKNFVEIWCTKHTAKVQDAQSFFEKMHNAGSVDLSMLVVAEQKLRRLYGG